MEQRRPLRATLAAALWLACCSSPASAPDSRTGHDVGSVPDGRADAADSTPGDGPAQGDQLADLGSVPACLAAQCSKQLTSVTLKDAPYQATASVSSGASGCQRGYQLSTTQPLLASAPATPRALTEQTSWPTVRTCSPMFDALYALALDEVRQNSVASISDGAFNNGKPMTCPAGGCFETGKQWRYVWTRDTAYSVDLGLAALDPTRAMNSLLFKLSRRRDGSAPEIVQDTGTGGSYPVSTDRVVWSMGARTLLHYLSGSTRTKFRDQAYAAMKNTIARDRAVAFDATHGLYRGEQSFLDWREQSYPPWVKDDPVHIGMSKALSTNVGHLSILELAAQLGLEQKDSMATTFLMWATSLRAAIFKRFYVSDSKLLGTMITTGLDQAVAGHYDLLGSALAVLYDVGTPAHSSEVLARYPHLPKGPPVIWPQQQQTPIYHNRALWPFVTAYWLRAAKKARNDAAAVNGVASLMRGAALNLSNMENFEMVSGLPHVKDPGSGGKDLSGPVINSPRQLWSVAGYVSMVHDIVFGLETSPQGIRFLPYIPAKLRQTLFQHATTLVLNNFPYHGKKITVTVKLPASSGTGAYKVGSVRINGQAHTQDFVPPGKLAKNNLWEVTLVGSAETASTIKLVKKTSDMRQLFGPRTPKITGMALSGGKIKVSFNSGGQAAADIAFNIYCDGNRWASALAGSSTSWIATNTSSASPSHCCAVESYFLVSGNVSRRSAPWCYWGPGSNRVKAVAASSFKNSGGKWVVNHGKGHYEGWGDPGHKLVIESFKPSFSGDHLLQVVAGNGAGPINTGVTCALKVVLVQEAGTGKQVAKGYMMMPHLGNWTAWRDASFVRVKLSAAKTYRVTISSDKQSVNMSAFAHFKQYTGGQGGSAGAFNRVNIAQLKVLSLTAK